ncbi:hypothetical protein AVEN_53774-1 [Araneus ventricosus]|uniref:Dynein axonemal assembly factor 5 TPR repeats domain-containing protein n=2 Tax=Araneus ventricosus TaxID=182803 RepID=A0A4Y2K9L9_ARAVE|nr:hypothetical protein AVEN_53774-1 [Araneus ventricosus]
MENLEDIYNLLFSARKLERDQGMNHLKEYLSKSSIETIHSVEKIILNRLSTSESGWESKHGALLGAKSIIMHLKGNNLDENTLSFLQNVYERSLGFLTDNEVRIRLAAGEVLGSLCYLKGPEVYNQCKDYLLQLIKENMERDVMDISDASDVFSSDAEGDANEPPKGQRVRRLSSDAAQIFHDTAGWKCLETSMKCLQFMVDGCGENFKPFITNEFLDLLFKTLSHTNRFVRETGYYVLASLVGCGTSCKDNAYNAFAAENFGHQISVQLGIGLSDNWSQVRLASSECARKFLLSFESEEEREVFFSTLLPKMCLNRYYIADGVRIYSQESWRRIVKENGRMFVKKYIDNFVQHYISQTKADNHAVREAACACIAELASKIDHEATKPYVSQLLQTLIECFCDDSWPVRDAACLACGNFVLCFPNESKVVLEKLYPLFFTNLKDGIPSVRQGAAGALANVVKAYGVEAYLTIKPQVLEGLKGVKDQPSESEKYSALDKGPATFGVVKRLRDNDMELHTNQQMYSCGSLAPKMGRGGGCSDHKFRKPSEPWELADGCVHLVAELSQINELTSHICEIIPLLHEAASFKHYTHHVCLLESLCKQLPNLCKGIGKRHFKQFLEMFLEDIFYSLTCENILTSSAASQCLTLLSNMLGPNILRARIENLNPGYLKLMETSMMVDP